MTRQKTPDLQKILERLQKQYFPDCPSIPPIVWKYPNRKSDGYVLFGLYRPDEQFIYVSWALSAPWVPDYFLEMVVYHEFCHYLQDVYPMKGETAHSERFKEWEQRHKAFHKAAAWEDANLVRVLKHVNKLVKRLHRQ